MMNLHKIPEIPDILAIERQAGKLMLKRCVFRSGDHLQGDNHARHILNQPDMAETSLAAIQ